jgi:hypothetical protein
MLSTPLPGINLSNYITVKIIIPRCCVRTVAIPGLAKISMLKNFVPNPNTALIYKGIILQDEQTIDFYRLNSNDIVVAVPESPNSANMKRWISITEDSELLSDSLNLMLNVECHRESLRLRDLVSMRQERRRKFWPKMERRIRDFPDEPVGLIHPTVVPGRASELCESPLPICW